MAGLETKTKLREELTKQLDAQLGNFTAMEREAQALLRKATHAGRKVTVGHVDLHSPAWVATAHMCTNGAAAWAT